MFPSFITIQSSEWTLTLCHVGSPGADRVVITEDSCKQAGTITHTGASGNNFVACDGTS